MVRFVVFFCCDTPVSESDGFPVFSYQVGRQWDASGMQSFLLAHLTTIMREVKKCPDSDITRRDQD